MSYKHYYRTWRSGYESKSTHHNKQIFERYPETMTRLIQSFENTVDSFELLSQDKVKTYLSKSQIESIRSLLLSQETSFFYALSLCQLNEDPKTAQRLSRKIQALFAIYRPNIAKYRTAQKTPKIMIIQKGNIFVANNSRK